MSDNPDAFTHEYLEAAIKDWGDVIAEKMGQSEKSDEIYLQDVFIEPKVVATSHYHSDLPKRTKPTNIPSDKDRLGENRKQKDEPPRGGPSIRNSSPSDLIQVLQENPFVVLLGEPGAGKTTALEYIGLCLAKGNKLDWPDDLKNRIPILIKLKHYSHQFVVSNSEPPTFINILANAVKDKKGKYKNIAENLVTNWLNAGRLFIMLDGLDEVTDGHAENIKKVIREFINDPSNNKCRLILTSRIAGFGFEGFPSALKEYIITQRPEDALPYLMKWIKAFKQEWPEQQQKTEAANLLREIKNRPGLRRALDTPLLIRRAAETYVVKGLVANDRAELYKWWLDELLVRAARRTGNNKADTLQHLEESTWEWQIGKDKQSQQGNLGEIHLREQLEPIVGRGDQVDSVHETIWEYLVAYHLDRDWHNNNESTWTFIRPRLHIAHWREPILLTLHRLGEEDASKLLEKIWKCNSLYEDVLHRDILFAGDALNDGVAINTDLRNQLLEELLQLHLNKSSLGDSVAQSLEDILSTLPSDDKDHLSSLLLEIAKGQRKITKYYLDREKRKWWEGLPPFLAIGFWYLYQRSLWNKLAGIMLIILLWPLFPILSAILLTILLILLILLVLINMPELIRDGIDQIRHHKDNEQYKRETTQRDYCLPVFETLFVLKPQPLKDEWIEFLVSTLKNRFLFGLAAKFLGSYGPFCQSIVDGFVRFITNENELYYSGYEMEKAIEAIGIYGQRYPVFIASLVNLVRDQNLMPMVRQYSLMALFITAKVHKSALELFFEIGKKDGKDGKQNPKEADESGLLDAYAECLKSFGSTSEKKIHREGGSRNSGNEYQEFIEQEGEFSYEVIKYLLDDFLYNLDEGERNDAGRLLGNVFGSNPSVRCKVVSKEGLISYTSVDFTEDIFDALWRSQISLHEMHIYRINPLPAILVRWGFWKPDIIQRLIALALNSEFMLAQEIRNFLSSGDFWMLSPLSEIFLLTSDPDEVKRLLLNLRNSAALLTDGTSEIRNKTYFSLLRLFKRKLPKNELQRLLKGIEYSKWQFLEALYRTASSIVWSSLMNEPNWNYFTPNCARVLAALANFRGYEWFCNEDFDNNDMDADDIQQLLYRFSEKANAILRSPSDHLDEIIGCLSSVLQGKVPGIIQASLIDYENKEYFKVCSWQSAAAYALTILASDEAQDELLSGLESIHIVNGKPCDECTWGMRKVMWRVRNAKRDFVAKLIEHKAIGSLEHPQPETKPLLISALKESYDPDPLAGDIADKKNIFRVLGTLEVSTEKEYKELVETVKGYLRNRDGPIRSAAAQALTNIEATSVKYPGDYTTSANHKELTKQIHDSLFGSVQVSDQAPPLAPFPLRWIRINKLLPDVAVALGEYAVRFAAFEGNAANEKLSQAAMNAANKRLLTQAAMVLHETLSPTSKNWGFRVAYGIGRTRSDSSGVANALHRVVKELDKIEVERSLSNLDSGSIRPTHSFQRFIIILIGEVITGILSPLLLNMAADLILIREPKVEIWVFGFWVVFVFIVILPTIWIGYKKYKGESESLRDRITS